MTRAFLTAFLLLFLASSAIPRPALGADAPKTDKVSTPEKDIPFNDPAHVHYFKYQAYLVSKHLSGQTQETWAKLELARRVKRVSDGEAFLKKKFEQFMRPYADITAADRELLEAVWSKEVAEGVKAVDSARNIRDPEQVKLAIEKVNGLASSLQDLHIDWDMFFEHGKRRNKKNFEPADKEVDTSDPVAVKKEGENPDLAVKKEPGFLDSLDSEEIRGELASYERYKFFLESQRVPSQVMPAMLAMYSILSKANEDEKKEIGHILPTVVHFLKEGKNIVIAPPDPKVPDAAATAVSGAYGLPIKVTVTETNINADPIINGNYLVHEFQHIYDMYTGRYTTLDTEMRGFKSNVLFMRLFQRSHPEKYKELLSSDDDYTRRDMARFKEVARAYEESPASFAQQIAFGQQYNQWAEGTFKGNMSLREAVDPKLGAPRQLQAYYSLRRLAETQIKELKIRQEQIRRERAAHPSRKLDKELEKVTMDLSAAESAYNGYDTNAALQEINIRRMQSEVEWLDKKSQASGQKDPPPFDLSLPVDKNYMVP